MKDKLKAVMEVLETLEVHGKDNLRRLLACMNSLESIIQQMQQEKESAPE